MKDEIVLYQPNEQFQLEVQLKDETVWLNLQQIALLFDRSHDRFLCIDDTVYHIGSSLKDLGKKWFAFNRMEQTTDDLLSKM